MSRGLFVSFEGGEGTGKSTQARLLYESLLEAGHRSLLVHEPGSTELGWYLRNYLKTEHGLSKEAELFLFAAARVELVTTVIVPSLDEGIHVVADRFADSTMAYQGYGRRISLEAVRLINSFATGDLAPDLTLLLDIPPKEGLRRVGHPQLRLPLGTGEHAEPGRQDVEGQRQFEDQPSSFHQRVREGYQVLAKQTPGRWLVIDATQPEHVVRGSVWQAVLAKLKSTEVQEQVSKRTKPLL